MKLSRLMRMLPLGTPAPLAKPMMGTPWGVE